MILLAYQATGGDLIPRPPTPGDFEAYGFAGVIFASFFFLVCVVIALSWRYFMKRDELWVQIQEKRDKLLEQSLDKLGTSHERAVERMALSVEKSADASTSAMKELAQEVRASHRVFGEETITGIIRRALRDVKQHDG